MNALWWQWPCNGARSTAEWLELLEKRGIPAGPVLSIDEMHNDPQTLARDMVPEVVHPIAGPVRTLGLPVKFSESPGGVRRPAPLLGQHTREVLLEAGYSEAQVDELIRTKAATQEDCHA